MSDNKNTNSDEVKSLFPKIINHYYGSDCNGGYNYMNKDELNKAIHKVLDDKARRERFIETLLSLVDRVTVDEKDMWWADPNFMLGRTTLMVTHAIMQKAMLIHNTDTSSYNKDVIDAKYLFIFIADVRVTTKCKINTKTFEVFDIELTPEIKAANVNDNCKGEYVIIDNYLFPVFPKDKIHPKNVTDFWYGENE